MFLPPILREQTARRGGVVFWLVLSLTVVIGVVALGMDGGRMMEERRRVQAACDAAALAGAADLYENYQKSEGKDLSGSAKKAALKVAAANGYANDGTRSVVSVNIPPRFGTFAGRHGHIEVIIESNLPATFGAIFVKGSLKSGGRVATRVVARGLPKKIGITALRDNGDDAFTHDGNGTLTIIGAPILVDSSGTAAYRQTGKSTITAQSHDIAGDYVQSGGGQMNGPVHTGVPPSGDPLLELPAPNPADCTLRAASATTINTIIPRILQPGVYRGGIKISGPSIVTMLPGVYVMDGGGLEISGNGVVLATGVVVHNTGGNSAGPVSITAGGVVTWTAPVTGPYTGISVFQDRGLTKTVTVNGKGALLMQGLVYAAGADVKLSGNSGLGGLALGGGYVANTIQVSGDGTIIVTPGSNRPLVPEVRLVE